MPIAITNRNPECSAQRKLLQSAVLRAARPCGDRGLAISQESTLSLSSQTPATEFVLPPFIVLDGHMIRGRRSGTNVESA